MMTDDSDLLVYVVTDIEADGPVLGENSMLSFASVAVSHRGEMHDEFVACLGTLDGASAEPNTLAWLQSQPEVWAAATRDPRSASVVMNEYAEWVRTLPGEAVFAAHPLMFDGVWMDWYLRRFTGYPLLGPPHRSDRLFFRAGVDIGSLIMGATGWGYRKCFRDNYPEEWFGGFEHNHIAIDDAKGYAQILARFLAGNLHVPQVDSSNTDDR